MRSPNATNVPLARTILLDTLSMQDVRTIKKQVRRALSMMTRKPSGRRARKDSDDITPAKVRQIKRMLADYPEWSYKRIAEHCNVKDGRVSEVYHGAYDQ